MLEGKRLLPDKCLLMVVDIQDAFTDHIHQLDRVIERSKTMIQAAQLLELPIIATEQYPKGLGPTVEPLRDVLANTKRYDKTTFSCCQDPAIKNVLIDSKRPQVLLIGIEAHICLAQTAHDLLEMDLQPYIAIDAVSSRRPHDCEIALQRLHQAGAVLTSTEAAIMEMTVSSKHPAFKAISQLIK